MEGLEPGLVARVVSNSRLMNFSRDLTSDTMMRLARMKKEVEMLEKSQITAPILKYSLNKFFFRTFLCSMEFKYIHVGSAVDQRGHLGGDQGGPTVGPPPTLALVGTGCSSLTSAKFFPRPGSLSTPGSQSGGGGTLTGVTQDTGH